MHHQHKDSNETRLHHFHIYQFIGDSAPNWTLIFILYVIFDQFLSSTQVMRITNMCASHMFVYCGCTPATCSRTFNLAYIIGSAVRTSFVLRSYMCVLYILHVRNRVLYNCASNSISSYIGLVFLGKRYHAIYVYFSTLRPPGVLCAGVWRAHEWCGPLLLS